MASVRSAKRATPLMAVSVFPRRSSGTDVSHARAGRERSSVSNRVRRLMGSSTRRGGVSSAKLPDPRPVQAASPTIYGPPMKYDAQDFALRVLFLVAGGVAALLLSFKGYGAALPAVAVGGALGAF